MFNEVWFHHLRSRCTFTFMKENYFTFYNHLQSKTFGGAVSKSTIFLFRAHAFTFYYYLICMLEPIIGLVLQSRHMGYLYFLYFSVDKFSGLV